MKTSTARRLVALGLGAALVLTGCSSPEDETSPNKPAAEATSSPEDLEVLKNIEVSGEPGKTFELDFDAPLTVAAPAALVIDEGEGEEIKDDHTISFRSVAYAGATGEVLDEPDSFGQEPASLALDPERVVPALFNTLVGEKVGTRIVFVNPNPDAANTVVMAIEVVGTKETPTPLDKATGEEVTPEEGLPTVTLDDSGQPSIDIPDGYAEPEDLIVQPLIKGDGEIVKPTDEVITHYTGWTFDGTAFDSSWQKGDPLTTPLTGVVQGWTEGLSGQTVGSQVLLVIPPELAYAGTQSPLKDDALIFVVDILAAS